MSRIRLIRRRAGLYATTVLTATFAIVAASLIDFKSTFSITDSNYFSGPLLAPVDHGGSITNTSAVGNFATTDDAATLQSELNTVCAAGGTLKLGLNKTYRIGTRLIISAKDNWMIDYNGSTIKCANGMTNAAGGAGSVIYVIDCDNWCMKNGTLDSNRANRTPVEAYDANVLIEGGSGWNLNTMNLINATCSDGAMVNGVGNNVNFPASNWLFYNVTITNSFRNCITVTASINGQFIGGLYQTSNGTNPEGGIDIEPDAVPSSGYAVDNLLILGVTFTANDGISLNITSGHGPVRHVSAFGCRFNGGSPNVPGAWNNAMGVDIGAGNILITYCTFEGFNYNTVRALINIQTANGTYPASNIKLRDNSFNTITMNFACIYVHSVSGTGNVIDLSRFFSVAPATVSNNGAGTTVTNSSTPGARTDPSVKAPPWPV